MNRIRVLCTIALTMGLTACDGGDPGSTYNPGSISGTGGNSNTGSVSNTGSASCTKLTLGDLIKATGISPNDVYTVITEDHFPIVYPDWRCQAVGSSIPAYLGLVSLSVIKDCLSGLRHFQGLVGPLHPDRRRQAIGGSFIILLGAAIKYRMK